MKDIKISKTTTGNVGEYYVAAELERRNFTTSVVGNNCKDYDIIAINNETHEDVLIQVKASCNRNSWRVNQNNNKEDKLFYVLVSLKDDEPKYYILKSVEAVNLKEKHHKEFCKAHGYKEEDKKLREIVLDDNLIKKYENNWQIIFDYCTKKENS
ncbi:MAG: hypothetical protein E7168_05945 [Firmicutes bacterium]|nr:hypothetical protein [Bacillota bacterium]